MKPKILIDLYKIKDLYSGLGQFSIQFYKHITPYQSHFDFTYLLPPSMMDHIDHPNKINGNFWRRYFNSYSTTFDLWHSLHQFPAHRPALGVKQLLTIHDLNFLIEKKSAKKIKYLNLLQRNVNNAHDISAISSFTAKMISENIHLKDKGITVIHNGVETLEGQFPKPTKWNLDKPYILTVSALNPKKNIELAIELSQYWGDKMLVIAGNDETSYGHKLKQYVREKGFHHVIFTGKVSEMDKAALYQHCEAFIFSSVAEGFGMPVIEAMRYGKPVFLNPQSSLTEIGGDLAYYFKGENAQQIAYNILTDLENYHRGGTTLQNKIIAYSHQFLWPEIIKKYVDWYENCLSR